MKLLILGVIAVFLLTALLVFLRLERFSAQRAKLKQCFKAGGRKCAKSGHGNTPHASSAASEVKPPAAQGKSAAQAQVQHGRDAPKTEAKVPAAEKTPGEAKTQSPAAAAVVSVAPPRIDLGVKHSLPQDSILRRHFLATLRAAIGAGMGPRPEDSVLRRHYDSAFDSKVQNCLTAESVAAMQYAAAASETASSPAAAAALAPAPSPAVKQPEVRPAAATAAPAAVRVATAANGNKTAVPQDSILRRHFMATLRFGIESGMGARPSDSILQRHYDNLIETKIEQRLADQ